MQEIVGSALAGFGAMPLWEWLAVVCGIAYVLLAAKESKLAWVFAFFGTLIYTILFWQGALLSSSLLNFYYMLMAIYGYRLWRESKEKPTLKITRLGIDKSILLFGVATLISLGLGYLFGAYFSAKFAYLDAFVFTLSLVATWMMAQKILENWLFWVMIDSAAIVLYFQSGYYPTVLLFMLYVVLAIYGYRAWRKESSAT
jgi:nicotinamide mononucleotide transporter